METQDFTTTILVDQTPQQVFDAINNVRGWWSEEVREDTDKLNDEFVYRHKQIHYSKQKLVEVIPNKKVVWLITDSSLSFTENKTEWNGRNSDYKIGIDGVAPNGVYFYILHFNKGNKKPIQGTLYLNR